MVQAAADPDEAGLSALQELCFRYWFPLYAFLRRRGYREQESQDLIQGFFLQLLERGVLQKADRERGRFRNFLLAALKNFVANESAKERTLRRGGGQTLLSLDFENAEGRLVNECVEEISAEAQFHRQWAVEVLDRAMSLLEQEMEREGKSHLFHRLRPYLSAGGESLAYADVAERLGMKTEAVRVATHRLRKRYRRCLEAEIRQTLTTSADLEDEIQELFRALRSPGNAAN